MIDSKFCVEKGLKRENNKKSRFLVEIAKFLGFLVINRLNIDQMVCVIPLWKAIDIRNRVNRHFSLFRPPRYGLGRLKVVELFILDHFWLKFWPFRPP